VRNSIGIALKALHLEHLSHWNETPFGERSPCLNISPPHFGHRIGFDMQRALHVVAGGVKRSVESSALMTLALAFEHGKCDKRLDTTLQ